MIGQSNIDLVLILRRSKENRSNSISRTMSPVLDSVRADKLIPTHIGSVRSLLWSAQLTFPPFIEFH